MKTRKTLVGSIDVVTDEASISRRDVVASVTTTPHGSTYVIITTPGRSSFETTLRLSGAERIALIEALGGTTAREGTAS